MSPEKKATIEEFGRAIARQLNARRAHQNLTQSDLAEATGISQSQVSKQLRGIRAINLDELDALCQALDIPMQTIIGLAEAELDAGSNKPRLSPVPSPDFVSSHDALIDDINAGIEPIAAQEATEPLEQHWT